MESRIILRESLSGTPTFELTNPVSAVIAECISMQAVERANE